MEVLFYEKSQKAIIKAEEIYGSENWELPTILQEKGNCYLYEKLGYKKTGKTEAINDKLKAQIKELCPILIKGSLEEGA